VRWSWQPLSLIEIQGCLVHAVLGDLLGAARGRQALDYAFTSLTVKL
jgi:hypothetical protein